MKKYLSIVLAMLFVLGFAASAFAVHADIPSETQAVVAGGATQITLGGEIRVRYDWRHVGFNDNLPDTSFFNERIRLGLEAKMSPNTTGYIQLTSNSDRSDPDNLVMGAGGSTGAKIYDAAYSTGAFGGYLGNEFKGSLAIRQMWILHTGTGLLGINSGIKIGHMPLMLGSGLFFDHTYYGDDAFVGFLLPDKYWELDGVAIKFREGQGGTGTVNLSNGAAAYAFIASYKPSKDTAFGFDATYVDAQNFTEVASATATYPNVHLWNFGLRANTAYEGFTFKIDGEFQTGEIDQRYGAAAGTVPNLKLGGYAVQAGVGYVGEVTAPVKLDLEFAYGSGDNGHDKNRNDTFITSQGPESTFGDPYRSKGIQGPYVYNYRTPNASGNVTGGLQNTWYIRLGANADLAKDWNADLALYYLQAVNVPDATTVATAAASAGYGLISPYFGLGNNIGTTTPPNHDIGFEVDYRLTYKIDKGLQTWIEGGYLWAGDFYRQVTAVAKGASPSDAFTTRLGIQLNF
ncbi:MAG: alginate export family protein [Nitrospirae bacterium]|nr:alginate export family protein [Nitrospirota bacterium]